MEETIRNHIFMGNLNVAMSLLTPEIAVKGTLGPFDVLSLFCCGIASEEDSLIYAAKIFDLGYTHWTGGKTDYFHLFHRKYWKVLRYIDSKLHFKIVDNKLTFCNEWVGIEHFYRPIDAAIALIAVGKYLGGPKKDVMTIIARVVMAHGILPDFIIAKSSIKRRGCNCSIQ
jgi:hypothetical protein